MVADYWSIFSVMCYKYGWRKWRFDLFSKYSQKIHQIPKPESRIKLDTKYDFYAKYCEE